MPPAVPPATRRVVSPPLSPLELRLDREHPWPGLISFTEADHSFFFGREKEVAELARVIRQKTVTVFFGKSGLGKSSILRAGVSPLLRQSELVPVYIRLNHDEAAPPLEDQVEIAIEEVLAREKIDAAKPARSETLWEYLHKKTNNWWDPENRLVKPILIFDQFEELLTLGQSTPERSARSAAFLTELEDLVENRPPTALLQRFEAERGLARNYDLEGTDYRVVLTLREDFLPDLEGLRERLRAIIFNRVRLLPMSGEQAMDVVLKPGGHLVDEDVAARIVDFVSSSERSRLQTSVTRAQLAKRSVEPALLSVVLQELNNRRLRLGQEKITAELVGQTNPTEIFHDFYLRGLQGMDGQVRDFIEDCLLTSSGARNRIAEEDALTKQGISSGIISTLIDRRIIQRETTGNIKWLELTHDTLADVVRADRSEHQQQRELQLAAAREAEVRTKLNRTRKLVGAFGGLLALAAIALLLGFLQYRAAERARQNAAASLKETRVSKSRFLADLARRKLDEGQIGPAVALARLALPTDILDWPKVPSAENALALAVQSYWSAAIRPVVAFVGHKGTVRGARFSPDETRVLTWSYDGTARLWETKSGKQTAVLQHEGGVRGAIYAPKRILTWSFDGTARLWNNEGKPVAILRHDDILNGAIFSRDLKRVLTWSCDGTARLWDALDGKPLAVMHQHGVVLGALFLRQDTAILTWSFANSAHVWNAADGQETAVLKHDAPVRRAIVFSDQTHVLTSAYDDSVRVWDSTTGAQLLRLDHGKKLYESSPKIGLLANDTQISTIDDTLVRTWNVSDGKELRRFQHPKPVLNAVMSVDLSRLLTWCDDETLRIWDAVSGNELATLKEAAPITSAEWAPGYQAILTICRGGTAQVWKLTNGSWVRSHLGATRVRDAFFVSSDWVWTRSDDGSALLFSLSNPEHEYASLHHRGEILDWTSSQKSNAILTASADGTAELWDLSPPDRFRSLQQIDGKILGTKFSKDSSKLLSWSDNGIVQLSNTANGAQILLLRHEIGAEFLADETKILTHSEEGVTLWATDTGKQLVKLPLPKLSHVKLSANKNEALFILENGPVSLWDTVAGGPPVLLHDSDQITDGVFSNDGSRVLTSSSDGKARFWNTRSATLANVFSHPNLRYASLSPDARRAVTCSSDTTAILWDTVSGKAVATLKHGGSVLAATFSPDSTQLVTRSAENVARVWNAATGRQVALLPCDAPVTDARFCDGSAKLVTVSSRSVVSVARIWDSRDGKELARFRDMSNVAVSDDGTRMIGACLRPDSSVTVKLWDISTGELVAVVDHVSRFVDQVAYAADAKSFAAWGFQAGPVELFSVWSSREKLLAQASEVTARLRPLSRVDRAMAHLDPVNREALERTSERELALDGDVASRSRQASNQARSDSDNTIELVVNERSETFVFHSRPFSPPISRLEYNPLARSLIFVLQGGIVRDFGVGVDERMTKYLEKSDRILMVLMDPKTGEPIGGDYYPLLVY